MSSITGTRMWRASRMDLLKRPGVLATVRRALAEDIGAGDITTRGLVPVRMRTHARIIANQKCVLSGVRLAAEVFKMANSRVRCTINARDGQMAGAGTVVLTISGLARGILAAERTALNFLQRMSGIATLTRFFVRKADRRGVLILDTRKTAPGLRPFDKYAVSCGGGINHRMGLYDRILIKDNHLSLLAQVRTSKLEDAIAGLRSKHPGIPIEIEVQDERELAKALDVKPDWILFDNMTPREIRRCVMHCRLRCRTEASGGITLRNIEEMSRTGVDAISLGCLTHSAPSADFSLEIT